mgnify:CR=1 FL=1
MDKVSPNICIHHMFCKLVVFNNLLRLNFYVKYTFNAFVWLKYFFVSRCVNILFNHNPQINSTLYHQIKKVFIRRPYSCLIFSPCRRSWYWNIMVMYYKDTQDEIWVFDHFYLGYSPSKIQAKVFFPCLI